MRAPNRQSKAQRTISSAHEVAQQLGRFLRREPFAELVEEHHAASVAIYGLELVPQLAIRHLEAARVAADLELLQRQPPVIAVDLVEDPVDLVEVDEVH